MSRVKLLHGCPCPNHTKEGKMDDLISRQAAIETVDKWFKKIELNGDICLDGLRSLQPEPHWISCNERLPEEDVDVLCQTFGGTILVASYGTLYPYPWSTEKGWITAEFTRFSKETVTAWMSLPEPFRGDKYE